MQFERATSVIRVFSSDHNLSQRAKRSTSSCISHSLAMTLTVRLVVLAIAFLCGACATPSFTTVTTNGAGPLPRGTWGNAPISKTSRLFFGGLVNTNVNVFFNDTWVFTFLSKSSGIWTQLFPATVPSSRAFGYIASVEDENGNVFACMFGGVVFTSTSSTTSAGKRSFPVSTRMLTHLQTSSTAMM